MLAYYENPKRRSTRLMYHVAVSVSLMSTSPPNLPSPLLRLFICTSLPRCLAYDKLFFSVSNFRLNDYFEWESRKFKWILSSDSESSEEDNEGDEGDADNDDLQLLEATSSNYQQNLAPLIKQTQSRPPASVSVAEPSRAQEMNQASSTSSLPTMRTTPRQNLKLQLRNPQLRLWGKVWASLHSLSTCHQRTRLGYNVCQRRGRSRKRKALFLQKVSAHGEQIRGSPKDAFVGHAPV